MDPGFPASGVPAKYYFAGCTFAGDRQVRDDEESGEPGASKSARSAGPRAQFESFITVTIAQVIQLVKENPTLWRIFLPIG